MAEDLQTQADMGAAGGAGQGPGGVQVLLDERELRSVYANAYRIHTSSEEVIIDLGFNMPNPNQQQGGGAQLLFKVTDRVILTYGNAKRLSMSLTQLIKRYEQQFGELPVQRGGAGATGGAGR
ncbi:MAG TPA: DUF3467 domain-containing protein [Tepidisphaeraceae bacterium]